MTRSTWLLGLAVLTLLGAVASAETPESRRALDAAIDQLVKEAQSLDRFDAEATPLRFARPHPAVEKLGPELAVPCLERMMQPFTRGAGADYRDAYVRWHLMWVVKRASQDDRLRTGPRLVKLIRQLPESLRAEAKPEYRWEPPHIGAEYHRLVQSATVVEGYDPFKRVVGPPESLKRMDPDKAAIAKRNLAKAEELFPQFRTIIDKDAIAWNARIRQLNHAVRQYRGELIYALLLTGDPEMARLVFGEIDRLARQQNTNAFDLTAYVYLAAFDGALGLYDQKLLDELSAELEATARAAEKAGPPEARGFVAVGSTRRHFADYAFHLIELLKDGGGFFEAREAQRSAGRE